MKKIPIPREEMVYIWMFHVDISIIAGHGTVVSELNEVTKGAVLAKIGAEGIVTAVLPEQGLGIALLNLRGLAVGEIRLAASWLPGLNGYGC